MFIAQLIFVRNRRSDIIIINFHHGQENKEGWYRRQIRNQIWLIVEKDYQENRADPARHICLSVLWKGEQLITSSKLSREAQLASGSAAAKDADEQSQEVLGKCQPSQLLPPNRLSSSSESSRRRASNHEIHLELESSFN